MVFNDGWYTEKINGYFSLLTFFKSQNFLLTFFFYLLNFYLFLPHPGHLVKPKQNQGHPEDEV